MPVSHSGSRDSLLSLLDQVISEFNASIPDERKRRQQIVDEPIMELDRNRPLAWLYAEAHEPEARKRLRSIGKSLAPLQAAYRSYYARRFQRVSETGTLAKADLQAILFRLTRVPNSGRKRPAVNFEKLKLRIVGPR